MKPISQAATDRREASRKGDGEFGTQPHTEADQVQVPPSAVSAKYLFRDVLDAFCVQDVDSLRHWAKHAGIDLGQVGDGNIQMAIYSLGDDGWASWNHTLNSSEDARWATAERHLGKIATEAKRRHEAYTQFVDRIDARPAPASVKTANASLQRAMVDADELGLLPTGTKVHSSMSGRLANAYADPTIHTLVRLEGMPERLAYETTHDENGDNIQTLSPYGQAVETFLHRIASDTQRSLTAKPSWPIIQIETHAARKYRFASQDADTAQKLYDRAPAEERPVLLAALQAARLARDQVLTTG